MPYVPFDEYFPKLAESETRVITIFPGDKSGIPIDSYAFCELFCNEPGCDCRRVFFTVMSEKQQQMEVVVAYGWETKGFYAKWLGDNDPATLAELQGPVLNLGSPQSKSAPAILQLVKDVLLQDPAYVERVKHHYDLFRQKIDGGKRKWKVKNNGKGFGRK
jgi:hypothetical protein